MRRVAAAAFLAFALVLAGLGSLSCQGGYSGPVEEVSIAITTNEVNSLILVARERGYFTANGINLTREIYSSGVAAIEGTLNSEVDMAVGSEFAFANKVLSGGNIRTIGSICRSSTEYLVGRVDRGIDTLADLDGKTVGVPLGSRPEFALDRFFYFHGVDTSELTLVNIPVNRSVEALANGEVDAVASWQPYIDQAIDRLDNKVVVWDVQEDQPSYTLVMCQADWTVDNPELITRFLKSLIEAEAYIDEHPDEARALIQQQLNYTEDYMASVWQDYRFSVMLNHALVVALEDQARWIINDLTSVKETPNFVNYIYIEGLEEVKPEAVNIIR